MLQVDCMNILANVALSIYFPFFSRQTGRKGRAFYAAETMYNIN